MTMLVSGEDVILYQKQRDNQDRGERKQKDWLSRFQIKQIYLFFHMASNR